MKYYCRAPRAGRGRAVSIQPGWNDDCFNPKSMPSTSPKPMPCWYAAPCRSTSGAGEGAEAPRHRARRGGGGNVDLDAATDNADASQHCSCAENTPFRRALPRHRRSGKLPFYRQFSDVSKFSRSVSDLRKQNFHLVLITDLHTLPTLQTRVMRRRFRRSGRSFCEEGGRQRIRRHSLARPRGLS